VDLAGLSRRLRDTRLLIGVVLVNLVGIAYGFVYYVPQFALTPGLLWPLVPDSPMAVLLMTVGLAFVIAGRWRPWVNLLGAAAMVKVGLWTAFVLLAFPEHFGFSLLLDLGCETGLLGCGNLNTVLFYSHLGMALEALVVADLLPREPGGFLAVGGLLVGHDILDYAWPADHVGRGCEGIFPHTVPCTNVGLTFAVTVGLTLATMAGLWWMNRWASSPVEP
jgi:uncharacterized membrane protein YpjA